MTLPAYAGVLTPAHRQIVSGIRDRWAAAVSSTAPVDRAAAAEAVRRLYETHKLHQPSLTIWMDLPLGCIYAAAVVGQLREQLRNEFVTQLTRRQLQYQLGRQLGSTLVGLQTPEQLGDQLGVRLRGPLSSELEDQLTRGPLQGQLNSQLWGQLRGQIKGKLPNQLWDQLSGGPWDEFWDQFGASSESSWVRGGVRRTTTGDSAEIDGWDGAGHLHSVFPWNDADALAFDDCVLPIANRQADPSSRRPEQRSQDRVADPNAGRGDRRATSGRPAPRCPR